MKLLWDDTKGELKEGHEIHMNKLDARQQLLTITMEECGELIQACSKVLRTTKLYDDNDEHVQNLKREIGDVYTMIELMIEWDVLSWDDIDCHYYDKRPRLKKYSDLIEQKEKLIMKFSEFKKRFGEGTDFDLDYGKIFIILLCLYIAYQVS